MRRLVYKFATVPCAALAVLLSPLAGAAGTAVGDPPPGYEVVSRLVKFSDLNLADPKGVKTLYGRIQVAAKEVCGPVNSRNVSLDFRILHCRELAVSRAIADVNVNSLSTYHRVATNQPELVTLR